MAPTGASASQLGALTWRDSLPNSVQRVSVIYIPWHSNTHKLDTG